MTDDDNLFCRPCAQVGSIHRRPPHWWQRVLHWMGYWP